MRPHLASAAINGRIERHKMLNLRDLEPTPRAMSVLTLSDRLIALAEDADRAGFQTTAANLIRLACAVFDEVDETRH